MSESAAGLSAADDDPSAALPLEARAVITRGIVWNSAFQVFLVGINFVSMIVLVRVLSPKEYGRAAAVSGVLALINCFNCSACISQAIQLPGDAKPDWGAHWRAGMWIQLGLCLLCNVVAAVAWFLPAYQPIAPVLAVASIGLLIDVPSQVGGLRLRRAMDFRTLRLVHAAATLVTVVSSIVLAVAGAGAYALIISSNVLHGIPFGLYLLMGEKWRPPERWWRWPDWAAYRVPLQFGAQQSGSAVLAAGRGLLESLVIPPLLGYEALGLLNRAQVLFTTTAGRATSLVIETVYPMLPRSAADPVQFARHATIFVQTMLLISIPGAIFVGIEGPLLSRLLYGGKWVAADPLIWPGTIFAWGVATVLVFMAVLQAQNRLRVAFISSVITASLCLPAMMVAAAGAGLIAYAWALAAGQAVATIVVMKFGAKNLETNWLDRAVVPPVVSTTAAAACVIFLLHRGVSGIPLVAAFVLAAIVFGLVFLSVLRILFPEQLREVLLRVPGGMWLRRLLRIV